MKRAKKERDEVEKSKAEDSALSQIILARKSKFSSVLDSICAKYGDTGGTRGASADAGDEVRVSKRAKK